MLFVSRTGNIVHSFKSGCRFINPLVTVAGLTPTSGFIIDFRQTIYGVICPTDDHLVRDSADHFRFLVGLADTINTNVIADVTMHTDGERRKRFA